MAIPEQMDFATALGKLCDAYGMKLLAGAGELSGNTVVVEREGDVKTTYAVKRYRGFYALEVQDGEDHA